MQVAEGFCLGLDTEPRTFAVKLLVIVQYQNMDCNSGMSRRETKEAMAQESGIGVIHWVMLEHE